MTTPKGSAALRHLTHVDSDSQADQGSLGHHFYQSTTNNGPYVIPVLSEAEYAKLASIRSIYEAMTDEELMGVVKHAIVNQAIDDGNAQTAFAILYANNQELVNSIARSRGLRGQDIDDATAQVFCNVWAYAKSWDEERATNFQAWISTITVNTIKKLGSKKARQGITQTDMAAEDDDRTVSLDSVDGAAQPVDMMAEGELSGIRDELFWEALGSLGFNDWGIILDHHFYGRSLKECGEDFDISLESAKMRLYRARLKLAKEIITLHGVEKQEAVVEELFLN